MKRYIQVFLGGGLGATTRYGIGLITKFGVGIHLDIILANVIGCGLMGCFMGRLSKDGRLKEFTPLIGTGFLGGLTTFSSYTYYVNGYLREDKLLMGMIFIVVDNILGMLLLYIGYEKMSRGESR